MQLFKIVLGFTPSRQPSRAHQSRNDLEQRYSGTSVALPDPVLLFPVVSVALPDLVSLLPFPVSQLPVFPTCNVRKKIGLPRTFSSGRVTSGTAQRAFLCSYSSCSKSFGESTPHREACRAHSSPNSPILPRLVRPPSLEGTARHIVHQTIWHKASERCHRALFG